VTAGDYLGLLALVVPETADSWIIYMSEEPHLVPINRDPIQWDFSYEDDESCLRFIRELGLQWLEGNEEGQAEAMVFDLRRTWSVPEARRRQWPWKRK
jgi:hypothetical protein